MKIIDRRRSGRAVVQVLALLFALVAAGGWNYYRNWQAEVREAPPRPFERYETADLEALRDAYEAEARSYQDRYSDQDARRRRASGSGLMDERVREFEKIQATSDRLRDLRADVADREARLRELETELGYRNDRAAGIQLHLTRLLTL